MQEQKGHAFAVMEMPQKRLANVANAAQAAGQPGRPEAHVMLQFDLRLRQRLPPWLRGRHALVAPPILRTLGRWSRTVSIDALPAVNDALRDVATFDRPAQLASPADKTMLCAAIAATEALGETGDGKQIRLARLHADSALLLEIGRLRELTFRKVGEGTGRSRDLDRYDMHYDHILLWDARAQSITGAYRVARGARLLAEHGLRGFYTASLFDYSDDAMPHLAEGMELGRSFVAPEYWNSRSLDYLWQGIGAYLRRYPRVRYLFGAVSISAALPLAAREQLVAYYQRFHGCADGLAISHKPFAYFAAPPAFDQVDADTGFRVLKANLDALGAVVPTLYKQYTDLCEPGGARFLAFGVDPDFNDAIDGLIEVDLQRMRPKKRQRYLQTAGAPA